LQAIYKEEVKKKGISFLMKTKKIQERGRRGEIRDIIIPKLVA